MLIHWSLIIQAVHHKIRGLCTAYEAVAMYMEKESKPGFLLPRSRCEPLWLDINNVGQVHAFIRVLDELAQPQLWEQVLLLCPL